MKGINLKEFSMLTRQDQEKATGLRRKDLTKVHEFCKSKGLQEYKITLSARAKAVLDDAGITIAQFAVMPPMDQQFLKGMNIVALTELRVYCKKNKIIIG